eukprot:COSAG02_NODE_6505_length_3533_cov_2.455154_3_plen_125_part_00
MAQKGPPRPCFLLLLLAAVSGGALGRLVTAFSREQAEKIYVQDRLREDGPRVAEMMVKQGAKVYVCGDGGAMFKGVNATLVCLDYRFIVVPHLKFSALSVILPLRFGLITHDCLSVARILLRTG